MIARGLRRTALRIGLIGALGLSALPVRAENLADALTMAYRHSGLIDKNAAVLRAADEDVAQAIALLRPIINYAATMTRTWQFPNDRTVTQNAGTVFETSTSLDNSSDTTSSLSITGDLLLWDGGNTRLQGDVAKELVLASRLNLLSVEQNVLLNGVLAYLGVREALAFVDLRENNVQLIGEQLRAAQDRFDVGEVTRTDVAVAEAAQASARSNLATARGDLQQARADYVRFVGRAPGTLAPVAVPPPVASSWEGAQAVARKMHPDILRAMRLVTVADINVDRAEASIKPRISATSRLSVGDEFEESASIGVQMTGPIYRGGQLTSLYRQAVARRDESRADLHITTETVFQNAAQAWALLDVARARIEAGNLEVRAASLAFESVQEEVRFGTRTTLDILDSEQDLQDARANLISSQIAQIRASYQLLASMGLMTVSHLGLNVVTYDPTAYYNAVRNAPVTKVSPQGRKLDALLRTLGKN